MKTIKIIDLLNMIANGEEVPTYIKVRDSIFGVSYKFADKDLDYQLDNEEYYLSDYICKGGLSLNDEVEIIEEKKIPMKIYWNVDHDTYITTIGHKDYTVNKDNFEELSNMYRQKINEIIDYINKEEK